MLVSSFEEIGWYDPDIEQKLAHKKATKWLKEIDFF